MEKMKSVEFVLQKRFRRQEMVVVMVFAESFAAKWSTFTYKDGRPRRSAGVGSVKAEQMSGSERPGRNRKQNQKENDGSGIKKE
jgi:hypothetical protein